MIDVNKLTADDLQILKNMLGIKEESTRSPMWRPLRDLRPPQTAKGRLNRPHFEWSADEPPEGVVIPPFPRLYWDGRGVEVRVESEDDLIARAKPDWTDRPPMANAMSEADRVRAEIALLSDEDREFLMTAHKQAKMDRLKEQMMTLSAADIASLASSATAQPVAVTDPEATDTKTRRKAG